MKQAILALFVFLTFCLQISFSQNNAEAPDFYKTDQVQDIKITFKQENWKYTLDSLRFNGDEFMEGVVEINGQKFEGAGIQYKDLKSFQTGSNRNAFNIQLDYKKEGQNIDGYSSIKLSNALRDPSMVREVLGYEIARNYMAAPFANYARLTVNGDYYALLVNIESVEDAAFRKRFFGNANNAFFKPLHTLKNEGNEGCKKKIYGSLEQDRKEVCFLNNFELLSNSGTKELMQLTNTLNQAADGIESILDVDATLWMHAFNNVLVNLNSYAGNHSVNYYLYANEKGQFTSILGDLNLALGSYKNVGGGSDLKTRQLFSLEPMLHADNDLKPLISKLLANPYYKKLYTSHVRSINTDYFVNGQYKKRTAELQRLIHVDFINDPGRTYKLEDFNNSTNKIVGKNSKIPGIEWLMEKRADYLKSHPQISVSPSKIKDIDLVGRQPLSNKRVSNFTITANVGQFPKKVTLMYRLAGQNGFKTMSMESKGDGEFQAIVTPTNGEKSMDYYIMAENASMISYSPANYMWEQHHTSLDELNK